MHSSRMRTARLVAIGEGGVCLEGLWGVCLGGGLSVQVGRGGVCLVGWGVCLVGCLSAQGGCLPGVYTTHPPVNRMTERQV